MIKTIEKKDCAYLHIEKTLLKMFGINSADELFFSVFQYFKEVQA